MRKFLLALLLCLGCAQIACAERILPNSFPIPADAPFIADMSGGLARVRIFTPEEQARLNSAD